MENDSRILPIFSPVLVAAALLAATARGQQARKLELNNVEVEMLDGKAVEWMEHVTDEQYGG